MVKEILSYIAIIAAAFTFSYYFAPFLIDSYLGFDKVEDVYCTEKGCYRE